VNISGNLLVYFFDAVSQIYITPAITVTDPITFLDFATIPSKPTTVRIDKNPTNSNLYYTIGTTIYQVAISGCTSSAGPCYGASPVSLTIPTFGSDALTYILFDDQYDLLVSDKHPDIYYVKASDMSYTNIPFASGGPSLSLFTQPVDLGGTVDRLQPNNVSPSPAPATLDPTYLFLYDQFGGTVIYYYQYSCQ
jgi:hypothetical protein